MAKFVFKTTGDEILLKEKNSKFLAACHRVSTEEDIRNILISLRKVHPKANHVCFGWRLGWNPPATGNSDDGEPSYTAGTPILGQIEKLDLTDALVTVVRYFGGVKLGKGGLIKAYRTAAAQALDTATLVEFAPTASLCFNTDYTGLNSLRRIAGELKLELNTHFDHQGVHAELQCPPEKVETLRSRLSEFSLYPE